jgi:chromate transporter
MNPSSEQSRPDSGTRSDVVPLPEAVKAWALISLQTFGGPAGQIAVMQRHLVEERRWLGHRRFLHALNYCMLLPGPEAQQLAIYVGWLLNGTVGGLIAGALFVLPGFVALLALSAVYVAYGESTLITALFAGLAPAVVAVVAQAVWRVGTRVLANRALLGIAVAAFVALAFAAFPIVIAAAAIAGWLLYRWRPSLAEDACHGDGPTEASAPLIPDDALHHDPATPRRAVLIPVVGLLLWFVPIGLVAGTTGVGSVYTQQGLFFSGTAVVTFGGAYAVLAYVAQRAVEDYGWLTAGDMVRGLALAESTPGPLIMVLQFVAFLGAYRNPDPFDPWTAGVLASVLATWVTFVPCFLFVLLGAPYVERLRGNRALSAALTGISAAVVGVIANLGLYFATHTLFAARHAVTIGPVRLQVPDFTAIRPVHVAIAVFAAVLVFRWKWPVLRVLAVAAVAGLAAGLSGLPVS